MRRLIPLLYLYGEFKACYILRLRPGEDTRRAVATAGSSTPRKEIVEHKLLLSFNQVRYNVLISEL